MHSSLHEIITTGLKSLVERLKARMLPVDQYTNNQAEILKRIIARLEQDHGSDAEVYLMAHWALQVHELLQTQGDLRSEIALGDLERMQALARLLSLNEEHELLSALRAQIENGPYTFASFRAVSSGLATIEEVTTVTLEALSERMALLGGEELRGRTHDPVALLTALAERETVSRFLLNASRNRLQQCVILAHMVMIMRELQRLKIAASPVTATADALRLAQLGEVVGVPAAHQLDSPLPTSEPTTKPASSPPDEESSTPEQEESAPLSPETASGLTIDLSQAILAEDTAPSEDTEGTPVAADSVMVDRVGETEALEAPETSPEPDPPVVSLPVSEADPLVQKAGSGLGRMIIMLLLALGAVALLILFVVRPSWWTDALATFQELTGEPTPVVATDISTPTVESLPTATVAVAPTATPEPPTATPLPEPTTPVTIVTANIDLALYEWPHLASAVMDTLVQGTVVIPVQVVTGTETRWLRLEGGRYVLAEAVANVPTTLPALAVTELENMPNFSAVDTATSTGAREDEPPPERTVEEVQPIGPYLLATTRMRAGPGEEFEDKGELAAGTEVTLIGTSGDATWFMLANRYWVPVEVVSQVQDGLSVRVPPYALSDSNVRERPTTDAPRIGGVQENEILVLIGRQEGANPAGIWYQLDTGGWIFGGLVADAPEDLPEVE